MSVVTAATRNRINPVSVSTVEEIPETYDEVTLCNDPNCPVCRAQRRDKREKHRTHRKHRHHKRHHHKKTKSNFWNDFLPRAESRGSMISVHSVEVNERRPAYTTTQVTERAVIPANQTEQQVVSETRTTRVADEDLAREAWVNNRTSDDEIVCCRAYDGCRCPCWCCVILIVVVVIMVIILIVLLATLL